MDKTTKVGDEAGTQTEQETLQSGSEQTSTAERSTSKIEVDKQYTGAEAKKMVEDALSANGREQKTRADTAEGQVKTLTAELGTVTTRLNTVSGQVNELLRTREEAEADAVKDNPEALTSLRVKQTQAREEIRQKGVQGEQQARDAKQNERETALTQKETSVTIKLAAMAAGVDEKKLAEIVPDGDAGRLATAATLLKQSGTVEIDPETGKPKPAALTNTPASTISAGGDAKSVSEKMLADAKKK